MKKKILDHYGIMLFVIIKKCTIKYINSEIDRIYDMIKPYVEADNSKFCTNEEFEDAYIVLKEYVKLRTKSIKNQLNKGEQFEKVDASHIKLTDLEGYNNGLGWDGFLEKE